MKNTCNYKSPNFITFEEGVLRKHPQVKDAHDAVVAMAEGSRLKDDLLTTLEVSVVPPGNVVSFLIWPRSTDDAVRNVKLKSKDFYELDDKVKQIKVELKDVLIVRPTSETEHPT